MNEWHQDTQLNNFCDPKTFKKKKGGGGKLIYSVAKYLQVSLLPDINICKYHRQRSNHQVKQSQCTCIKYSKILNFASTYIEECFWIQFWTSHPATLWGVDMPNTFCNTNNWHVLFSINAIWCIFKQDCWMMNLELNNVPIM